VFEWDSIHVTASRRILQYLKGTIDLTLNYYRGVSLVLEIYADSDFAGELERNDVPMASLSGFIAYMRSVGAIYFSVNLEKIISQPTAETEYKTIGHVAKFAESIRHFLGEIGFPQCGLQR
jgi:hypothetical protein